MTDRRRQARFLFLAPADARIQVTIDGDVERWQDDLAVIISTAAAVQGDEFVLQLDSPSGESTTRVARVLGCDPILVGDALRFRLRLSTTPTSPPSDSGDGVAP
jgi:hypothetical protein